MEKTFIETNVFTTWWREHLDDDDLVALQRDLLIDPDKGVVMSGCGGLRKLRFADPSRGKGKRSGARVIYLHIQSVDQIYLIAAYGKGQKADLSSRDKKQFRELVQILKQLALGPRGGEQ